jgi:hypothetical protein
MSIDFQVFLVILSIGIIVYFAKKYDQNQELKKLSSQPLKDWKSHFEEKIPTPNLENKLIPPWEKFEYDRYDMGWRMGKGEDYLSLWWIWFAKLSDADKDRYQLMYPEPQETNWKGFYNDEFDDDENKG